jgi:DNA-binding transcriptional LysR family regulator
MHRRLNLHGLEIFEAAGRTGSFKAAAEKSFLSPSAVSQAIRKLEDELGVLLFIRKNQSVVLTDEGAKLLQCVSEGFDLVREGIDLLLPENDASITIYSSPTFASQVIRPALRKVILGNKVSNVRILTEDPPDLKSYRQFDIAILYGLANSSLNDVKPIGTDVFTPVCSPELSRQIKSIKDLLRFPLIASDKHHVSWEDWLETNGKFRSRSRNREIRVKHAYQAIAAAIDGLGITLESRRLVREELQQGMLVAPLWSQTIPVSKNLYFIYIAPKKSETRGVNELIKEMERLSGVVP